MTDEIKLQKASSRGVRAQQLLDNDLLKEALETMEREYTAALFLTKPSDSIAREKLYLAVNVTRKIRDHLISAITNGKLAQNQLNELQTEADRKKRLGIF